MSTKRYANFYTDRKFKIVNHNLVKITDENGYLFAKGIYKTKILEKDLPKHFVKLYWGSKYQYVSIKNIKDILYKPNYFTNHLYKDDFLYISYDKPIVKDKINNYYLNYEIILYGYAIVDFVKVIKANNTYNVEKIEEELNKKRKWYEENKI